MTQTGQNKIFWHRNCASLKGTAVFVIAAFLSSTIAWSAPPVPAAQENISVPSTTDVHIPEEFGVVEEVYQAPDSTGNSPMVIYIQDAHCIYEAQTNIRKMIDKVQKDHGLALVAVEGGEGKIDPTLFRTFPIQDVKEKVIDRYVQRGELSGADYAAIVNERESDFYGIEDMKLYYENKDAFLKAIDEKKRIDMKLDDIDRFLNKLKEEIYTPELKGLFNKTEDYEKEQINLIDYVKYLKGFGQISAADYPMISALLEAVDREQSMDLKKADEEAVLLERDVERALKNSNPEELKDFQDKFASFRRGEVKRESFIPWLMSKAGDVKVLEESKYPAISAYLHHIGEMEKIKGEALFKEIDQLTQSIKEKLFQNDRQRKLDLFFHRLKILRNLSKLELSRDELAGYRNHQEDYAEKKFWDFIGRVPGPMELDGLFEPHRGFYEAALKRDAALHQNLMKLLNERNRKFAMVITGGFHSNGIKEMLKRDGISYMLIVPRITQFSENTPYWDVMQGKVSYARFMKKETLAPEEPMNEPAFQQGVSAELVSSSGKGTQASVMTQWKISAGAKWAKLIDSMFGGTAVPTFRDSLQKFVDALRSAVLGKVSEVENQPDISIQEASTELKNTFSEMPAELFDAPQAKETVAAASLGAGQDISKTFGASMRAAGVSANTLSKLPTAEGIVILDKLRAANIPREAVLDLSGKVQASSDFEVLISGVKPYGIQNIRQLILLTSAGKNGISIFDGDKFTPEESAGILKGMASLLPSRQELVEKRAISPAQGIVAAGEVNLKVNAAVVNSLTPVYDAFIARKGQTAAISQAYDLIQKGQAEYAQSQKLMGETRLESSRLVYAKKLVDVFRAIRAQDIDSAAKIYLEKVYDSQNRPVADSVKQGLDSFVRNQGLPPDIRNAIEEFLSSALQTSAIDAMALRAGGESGADFTQAEKHLRLALEINPDDGRSKALNSYAEISNGYLQVLAQKDFGSKYAVFKKTESKLTTAMRNINQLPKDQSDALIARVNSARSQALNSIMNVYTTSPGTPSVRNIAGLVNLLAASFESAGISSKNINDYILQHDVNARVGRFEPSLNFIINEIDAILAKNVAPAFLVSAQFQNLRVFLELAKDRMPPYFEIDFDRRVDVGPNKKMSQFVKENGYSSPFLAGQTVFIFQQSPDGTFLRKYLSPENGQLDPNYKVPVTAQPQVIGRTGIYGVAEDKSLSRNHFSVQKDNQGNVSFSDVGSSFGTFVSNNTGFNPVSGASLGAADAVALKMPEMSVQDIQNLGNDIQNLESLDRINALSQAAKKFSAPEIENLDFPQFQQSIVNMAHDWAQQAKEDTLAISQPERAQSAVKDYLTHSARLDKLVKLMPLLVSNPLAFFQMKEEIDSMIGFIEAYHGIVAKDYTDNGTISQSVFEKAVNYMFQSARSKPEEGIAAAIDLSLVTLPVGRANSLRGLEMGNRLKERMMEEVKKLTSENENKNFPTQLRMQEMEGSSQAFSGTRLVILGMNRDQVNELLNTAFERVKTELQAEFDLTGEELNSLRSYAGHAQIGGEELRQNIKDLLSKNQGREANKKLEDEIVAKLKEVTAKAQVQETVFQSSGVFDEAQLDKPPPGMSKYELRLALLDAENKYVPQNDADTGRLPRPSHDIGRVTGRQTSDKQYGEGLEKIKQLLNLSKDSLKAKDLEAVRKALGIIERDYSRTQGILDLLTIKSLKDIRYPRSYKLSSIQKVVAADQNGSLDALLARMNQSAADSVFNAAEQEEFKTAIENTPKGFYMTKQGDEIGLIYRVDGKLKLADFSELDKFNAMNALYSPDVRDSLYHNILNSFHQLAQKYDVKDGLTQEQHQEFLSEINGAIQDTEVTFDHNIPLRTANGSKIMIMVTRNGRTVPTSDIEAGDKAVVRDLMFQYTEKLNGSRIPLYLNKTNGKIYAAKNFQNLSAENQASLTPLLGATGSTQTSDLTTELIDENSRVIDVKAHFEEMGKLNGVQKKVPQFRGKVMEVADISKYYQAQSAFQKLKNNALTVLRAQYFDGMKDLALLTSKETTFLKAEMKQFVDLVKAKDYQGLRNLVDPLLKGDAGSSVRDEKFKSFVRLLQDMIVTERLEKQVAAKKLGDVFFVSPEGLLEEDLTPTEIGEEAGSRFNYQMINQVNINFAGNRNRVEEFLSELVPKEEFENYYQSMDLKKKAAARSVEEIKKTAPAVQKVRLTNPLAAAAAEKSPEVSLARTKINRGTAALAARVTKEGQPVSVEAISDAMASALDQELSESGISAEYRALVTQLALPGANAKRADPELARILRSASDLWSGFLSFVNNLLGSFLTAYSRISDQIKNRKDAEFAIKTALPSVLAQEIGKGFPALTIKEHINFLEDKPKAKIENEDITFVMNEMGVTKKADQIQILNDALKTGGYTTTLALQMVRDMAVGRALDGITLEDLKQYRLNSKLEDTIKDRRVFEYLNGEKIRAADRQEILSRAITEVGLRGVPGQKLAPVSGASLGSLDERIAAQQDILLADLRDGIVPPEAVLRQLVVLHQTKGDPNTAFMYVSLLGKFHPDSEDYPTMFRDVLQSILNKINREARAREQQDYAMQTSLNTAISTEAAAAMNSIAEKFGTGIDSGQFNSKFDDMMKSLVDENLSENLAEAMQIKTDPVSVLRSLFRSASNWLSDAYQSWMAGREIAALPDSSQDALSLKVDQALVSIAKGVKPDFSSSPAIEDIFIQRGINDPWRQVTVLKAAVQVARGASLGEAARGAEKLNVADKELVSTIQAVLQYIRRGEFRKAGNVLDKNVELLRITGTSDYSITSVISDYMNDAVTQLQQSVRNPENETYLESVLWLLEALNDWPKPIGEFSVEWRRRILKTPWIQEWSEEYQKNIRDSLERLARDNGMPADAFLQSVAMPAPGYLGVEINIAHTPVSNLSALSGLRFLRALDLGYTRVSDLGPISTLPHLSKVTVAPTRDMDLSVLKNLPNLSDFYLSDEQAFNSKVDVSQIGSFSKLKRLFLGLRFKQENLGFLKELPDLKELELNIWSPRTDLNQIGGLTKLKRLTFFTRVPENFNLNFLEGLENLKDLELELKYMEIGNIPRADLTPVSKLQNLSRLVLNTNLDVDLNDIANGVEKLKTLDLSMVQTRKLRSVNEFKAAHPSLEVIPARGASLGINIDSIRKAALTAALLIGFVMPGNSVVSTGKVSPTAQTQRTISSKEMFENSRPLNPEEMANVNKILYELAEFAKSKNNQKWLPILQDPSYPIRVEINPELAGINHGKGTATEDGIYLDEGTLKWYASGDLAADSILKSTIIHEMTHREHYQNGSANQRTLDEEEAKTREETAEFFGEKPRYEGSIPFGVGIITDKNGLVDLENGKIRVFVNAYSKQVSDRAINEAVTEEINKLIPKNQNDPVRLKALQDELERRKPARGASLGVVNQIMPELKGVTLSQFQQYRAINEKEFDPDDALDIRMRTSWYQTIEKALSKNGVSEDIPVMEQIEASFIAQMLANEGIELRNFQDFVDMGLKTYDVKAMQSPLYKPVYDALIINNEKIEKILKSQNVDISDTATLDRIETAIEARGASLGAGDQKLRQLKLDFEKTPSPENRLNLIKGYVKVGQLPEARRLAAEIYDQSGGMVKGPVMQHEGLVFSANFSADGTRIVTVGSEGIARIWDAATGELIGEPMRHEHEDVIESANFSPDGTRIVTGSRDGAVFIWDASTGKLIRATTMYHSGSVNVANFSPDGTRIVTGSDIDGTVRDWNATTDVPAREPMRIRDPVFSVNISTDRTRIVTGSYVGIVRIWNVLTGEPGEPMEHEDLIRSANFSLDGSRIVTGSVDKTARIWDASTSQPMGAPMRHQGPVNSANFSPDGTRIVTTSFAIMRIWDASTGQPIGEPMRHHEDVIRSANFSPDGMRIVTGSNDETARLFSYPLQADYRELAARNPEFFAPEIFPEWVVQTARGASLGAIPLAEKRKFVITQDQLDHIQRHISGKQAGSHFTTDRIGNQSLLDYAKAKLEEKLLADDFSGGVIKLEIDTGETIGKNSLHMIMEEDIAQGKIVRHLRDRGKPNEWEVNVFSGALENTSMMSMIAGDIRISQLLTAAGHKDDLPFPTVMSLAGVFFPKDVDVTIQTREKVDQAIKTLADAGKLKDKKGNNLTSEDLKNIADKYYDQDFVKNQEMVFGFYTTFPGPLGEPPPSRARTPEEKARAEKFWNTHAFIMEPLDKAVEELIARGIVDMERYQLYRRLSEPAEGDEEVGFQSIHPLSQTYGYQMIGEILHGNEFDTVNIAGRQQIEDALKARLDKMPESEKAALRAKFAAEKQAEAAAEQARQADRRQTLMSQAEAAFAGIPSDQKLLLIGKGVKDTYPVYEGPLTAAFVGMNESNFGAMVRELSGLEKPFQTMDAYKNSFGPEGAGALTGSKIDQIVKKYTLDQGVKPGFESPEDQARTVKTALVAASGILRTIAIAQGLPGLAAARGASLGSQAPADERKSYFDAVRTKVNDYFDQMSTPEKLNEVSEKIAGLPEISPDSVLPVLQSAGIPVQNLQDFVNDLNEIRNNQAQGVTALAPAIATTGPEAMDLDTELLAAAQNQMDGFQEARQAAIEEVFGPEVDAGLSAIRAEAEKSGTKTGSAINQYDAKTFEFRAQNLPELLNEIKSVGPNGKVVIHLTAQELPAVNEILKALSKLNGNQSEVMNKVKKIEHPEIRSEEIADFARKAARLGSGFIFISPDQASTMQNAKIGNKLTADVTSLEKIKEASEFFNDFVDVMKVIPPGKEGDKLRGQLAAQFADLGIQMKEGYFTVNLDTLIKNITAAFKAQMKARVAA